MKKLARERARAIRLRIPQLKDCKNHFHKTKEKGKGTMVFVCEGQSAAGSINQDRCMAISVPPGAFIKPVFYKAALAAFRSMLLRTLMKL